MKPNEVIAKILLGLLAGVGVIAIIVGLSLISAILTETAWNKTMPFIFNLKQITFFQGFWLNMLAGLLVKSTLTVSK